MKEKEGELKFVYGCIDRYMHAHIHASQIQIHRLISMNMPMSLKFLHYGFWTKKKRNLPETPDPNTEVIALSPKTFLAMNKFICEICNKGFQRDQNLQLHRRGHNLPEKTCVYHNSSRALSNHNDKKTSPFVFVSELAYSCCVHNER